MEALFYGNKVNGKFTIKKYEDFIKFSEIKIENIVITNKTTKEGYIKLKDGIGWYKLYNKKYFKTEEYETLKGFLTTEIYKKHEYGYYVKYSESEYKILNYEQLKQEVIRFRHKDNNNELKYDDFKGLKINIFDYNQYNLYTFKIKELKFNIDEIIKDICNKTYTKTPKIYDLKEYEYIMSINSKHYIFNGLENKFYDFNDYNEKGIICNNLRIRHLKALTTTNINTEIVETVLELLIKSKTKIKEFQKLAYSIFVKKSTEEILFYNYFTTESLLLVWLNELYYLLLDDTSLYSYNYYKERRKYNKKIKNKHYRYVVIDTNDFITLNKKLKDFRELGITNIIVKEVSQEEDSIYKNIDEFKKYLNENKHLLTPYLLEKDESKINLIHSESIFYERDYLILNFLTWICSYTE